MEVLEGITDRFNGRWVDLSHVSPLHSPNPLSHDVFDRLLTASLSQWRSDGATSVWLKVPIESSHLISVAATHGFEYHHAEGATAVLCLWLDGSVESRIPRFATHQIGVSGVVVNEDNHEVLVIKEKSKRHSFWKFPGGLADLGEDFADTAVREVFEETGIQAEFQSILAFRQAHYQPNAFGRSDVYILCRLKPLSFTLDPCTEEVEAVQWMPLHDLLDQKDTSPLSRRAAQLIQLGFSRGFDRVDITSHPVESIYKNIIMQMFHRPLDGEER